MSTALDDALRADRDRRVTDAIDAYWQVVVERLRKCDSTSPTARDYLSRGFFNLIAIYFRSSDFGFRTAHGLPDEPYKMGELLALGVVAIAERACGPSDESEFWREKILDRSGLFDSDERRWNSLVQKYPHSGIVALGHMSETGASAERARVDAFLRDIGTEGTIRCDYLASIAESASRLRQADS